MNTQKEETDFSATREIQAICDVDKALIEAESSRNLELALSFMAADVILQPPEQPAVVGLEAVRQFYAAWFAIPYIALQVQSQSVFVAASADLAYLVGESLMIVNTPDGERQWPGKYLDVWRKIDHTWQLAAISWTGNISSGKA